MGHPVIIIELADDAQLQQQIAAGGVFVPTCALAFDTDCQLVVRGPGGELTLAARVVYVAPTGGAGLELVGFNAAMREQLAGIAAAGVPREVSVPDSGPVTEPIDLLESDDMPDRNEATEPIDLDDVGADNPDNDDSDDEVPTDRASPRGAAKNVQERLRGLTLAEQIKTARSGDPNVRTVLERMYGKNVWEALLRNPRLTSPEVARIARMGTLPRVQLETIVNNGAWLQIPEVRRALLSNPRMGTDQIVRVLRLMPKPELKLAASQTAYPFAVRDAAKRMIKDG